jgi:hypothetical protein
VSEAVPPYRQAYLRALEGASSARIAGEMEVTISVVEEWLEQASSEARSGTMIDGDLDADARWSVALGWQVDLSQDDDGMFSADLVRAESGDRVAKYGRGPTAPAAARWARERFEAEQIGRS